MAERPGDGCPGRLNPRPGLLRSLQRTTTTQSEISSGQVNRIVGFAPCYPAEFGCW